MSSGGLTSRLRFHASDPLLRSAYSLMVNVAVTGALGVVFWIAAARLYDADTLGRDAALIAAMMELSTICQFNMVNAITRFLPSLEQGAARALLGAYALSGTAALVTGAAFVVLAPLISDQFRFLSEDWRMAALYVLAQIQWTWFMLQDAALTALGRAPWVPAENGIFGLLKLGALPLFAALGAMHGIFVASVLPLVLLLLPVNVFLFRTAIPEHVRRNRPAGSVLQRLGRRRLVGFMAQDYGATVLAQASATALPLLVVALLGSSANAYFYIPYSIVIAFTMLFFGVCKSLVVAGALAEHRIRALASRIVRNFVVILVPGAIVMVAAAPLILLPFGSDYAREGAPLLRIMACGCLFSAATMLYIAIARLEGRGFRILAVEGVQMAVLLGGAVVLAKPLGLEGIALSWLGATAIVALAVLPSLVRFLRPPTTTIPAAGKGQLSPEELALR